MSDAMSRTERAVNSIDLPLQLTSDKIEQIGAIIDELRANRANGACPKIASHSTDLLKLARSLYRLRRARDEAFDARLFSDPSWDILLDLFIATEQGRKVSISSACIGSTAPATTALRHLSALVKHGLISRIASERDSRVSWVALTPTGHEKVTTVLQAWVF